MNHAADFYRSKLELETDSADVQDVRASTTRTSPSPRGAEATNAIACGC